jgi:MYXO-CTERM domain-containing protein
MRSRPFVLLALGAFLAAPSTAQTTLASSFFDSDNEGWGLIDDATTSFATWLPGVGNPAGSIQGVDTVSGGVWYFDAPLPYLGFKRQAYGQTLTWDQRARRTNGNTQSAFVDADVVLKGAGLELYALASPNGLPGAVNWTGYSVLLDATYNWRVGSLVGAPATEPQIKATLTALNSLWIRGEFYNGDDEGEIDNVVLRGAATSAPEPASLALAALGALALRRRRR